MKYLTRDEIDDVLWNQCIVNSPQGNPYALSWYLDIFTDGNWSALIQNDYQTVMPLPLNEKLILQRCITPNLCQQLGIFSNHHLQQDTVSNFIKHAKQRFRWIDLQVNANNDFSFLDCKKTARSNYVLPLNKPYESIFQSFNNNTKRNIKKSEQFHFQIIKDLQPEVSTNQFQLAKPKLSQSLGKSFFRNVEQLMFQSIHKKMGQLWSVLDERNSIASTIFVLDFNNTLYYLFSSNSESALNTGSSYFLLNSIIKTYSGTNFSIDFEGTDNENLSRFYKGFGAANRHYYRVVHKRFPFNIF